MRPLCACGRAVWRGDECWRCATGGRRSVRDRTLRAPVTAPSKDIAGTPHEPTSYEGTSWTDSGIPEVEPSFADLYERD